MKFKPLWSVAGVAALIGLAITSPFLFLWFEEQYSRWEYRDVIRRSFEQRLIPAASWVEAFVSREHRLPTDDEMRTQLGDGPVGIYREPPPWQHSWGVPGRDFMVCDSNGEWNMYYCSWNKQRIKAWTD